MQRLNFESYKVKSTVYTLRRKRFSTLVTNRWSPTTLIRNLTLLFGVMTDHDHDGDTARSELCQANQLHLLQPRLYNRRQAGSIRSQQGSPGHTARASELLAASTGYTSSLSTQPATDTVTSRSQSPAASRASYSRMPFLGPTVSANTRDAERHN